MPAFVPYVTAKLVGLGISVGTAASVAMMTQTILLNVALTGFSFQDDEGRWEMVVD